MDFEETIKLFGLHLDAAQSNREIVARWHGWANRYGFLTFSEYTSAEGRADREMVSFSRRIRGMPYTYWLGKGSW